MDDDHRIELADAIDAIRAQLVEAARRGADSSLSFEVGPISLEFTVELKADARARGGVRAWVLSADAEAGVARGETHKVAVSLTPRPRGSQDPYKVGDGTEPDVSKF